MSLNKKFLKYNLPIVESTGFLPQDISAIPAHSASRNFRKTSDHVEGFCGLNLENQLMFKKLFISLKTNIIEHFLNSLSGFGLLSNADIIK